MYRYKVFTIIVLMITIVCIASACNNSAGNQIEGRNIKIDDNTTVTTSDNNTELNKKNIEPTVSPTAPISNEQNNSDTNGNRHDEDNTVKDKIMEMDKRELSEEDFEITYESVLLNKETKVENIIKELGFPDDYEANNQGYISGNAKYRRWNLSYPNYSMPKLRVIVLSERKYVGDEVKDGNSYIVGIYLESYETRKGLKVGDRLEKLLQLYGKPESYENNILRYSKGSVHLEVSINIETEKVDSIFIDYNMDKSIEEQDGANN